MATLHSSFAALLPFDREETPLDIGYWIELTKRVSRERIFRTVQERLPSLPRARECLSEDHGLFSLPVWQPADRFALQEHLVFHRAEQMGDDTQPRLIAEALSRRFARGRPRWELHVLQFRQQTQLLLRHHVFWTAPANEAAWLNILLDPQPQPGEKKSAPGVGSSEEERGPGFASIDRAASLLVGAWKRWRAGRDVLDPVRQEISAVAELFRLALRPIAPLPFNGPLTGRRHAAWSRFPLAAIRTVRNRLGGTSWEILLSCALGGLSRILAERHPDHRIDALVALLPVAVGSEQDAQRTGRRVSLAVAKLSLRSTDPMERLRAVSAQVEMARLSGKSDQLTRGLNWLTPLVVFGGVGLLRTELRSPALHTYFWPFPALGEQRYFASVPVRRVVPLAPPVANLGLVFGLGMYADEASVSVVADPERSCDVRQLRAAIDKAFWELYAVAEGRTEE